MYMYTRPFQYGTAITQPPDYFVSLFNYLLPYVSPCPSCRQGSRIPFSIQENGITSGRFVRHLAIVELEMYRKKGSSTE